MDNSEKNQFINEMQYVVNHQQNIAQHMEQFLTHDPQVRPVALAVQEAVKTLAKELEHRGLQGQSSIWPTLNKDEMIQWAYRFAARQMSSNVPYAQKNDAALVPALKGYEAALEGVMQYCRDRIEHAAE